MNKVLTLPRDQLEQGIVAASTGNHGLGVAHAANAVGARCIVYVPETADASKVAAIRRYGAELKVVKHATSEEAWHSEARRYAASRGMAWVAPYNDVDVIAGQGTIAIELIEQLPEIDYLIATVGGGGLISGVACYLKQVSPNTHVIGSMPERSAEMYLSVQTGSPVEATNLPTLSDGSAGGFEPDSITFPLCKRLVDSWAVVSEDDIADAIRDVFSEHHKAIEGSAGVAVAAYQKLAPELTGKNVVIIACGGNIAPATLATVLR